MPTQYPQGEIKGSNASRSLEVILSKAVMEGQVVTSFATYYVLEWVPWLLGKEKIHFIHWSSQDRLSQGITYRDPPNPPDPPSLQRSTRDVRLIEKKAVGWGLGAFGRTSLPFLKSPKTVKLTNWSFSQERCHGRRKDLVWRRTPSEGHPAVR